MVYGPARLRPEAQQVTIQVWLSTHFGVIGQRLLTADDSILCINNSFTRCRIRRKGYSECDLCLLPPQPCSATAHRSRCGQYQP